MKQKQRLVSFVLEGENPEFLKEFQSVCNIKKELLQGLLSKYIYLLKQFMQEQKDSPRPTWYFKHFRC